MELTQRLQALLSGMGADLVGFGDVTGLAPDGYKTAVVAAIALPPDIIDDIPIGPTPAYLDIYSDYNRRLDEMSDAAAALLEREGFRTLSLNRAHAPWDLETMAAPFPHKTAATRAGLGWIGKCALLVTPAYGAAVRLTVTLTDAPLEVAQPITASRCGSCTACMDACPMGAISDTETETVTVCGKSFEIAKIDYNKCRICQNGAVVNRFIESGKPDRVAALCNRTCLCSLEERKALTNQFNNPFRTSEVWSIGGKDQKVDRSDEQANVLGGCFSKTGKRGH